MATVELIENEVEIPAGIDGLADFRRWAHSDDFPEFGRIDYIRGRIEVDMSPEDLFTHGTLKVKVVRALDELIEGMDFGILFSDRSRVSNEDADLSAEPDIVIVSHTAVDDGRVRWVPKASQDQGRYVEIEGSPDIVIEIVSDSSQTKDNKRLPQAYFDAGVLEYWLMDARGKELQFVMYRRGTNEFIPVDPDSDGWLSSSTLNHSFLLDRRRHSRGYWLYKLLVGDRVG